MIIQPIKSTEIAEMLCQKYEIINLINLKKQNGKCYKGCFR